MRGKEEVNEVQDEENISSVVTEEEKEIERILANVEATLGFEGLTESDLGKYVNELMLKGKITGEEARAIIFIHYRIMKDQLDRLI